MRAMEKATSNIHLGMMLLSASYIAMGVILLIFPNVSLVDICKVLGVLLLIVGVINVAWYFLRKCYLQPNHWGFSFGVAQCMVGLFMVLKPEDMALTFAQLLAICMVADNIIKLQFSMDLLRLGSRSWTLILIASLLMGALAMIILFNPFAADIVRDVFTYCVLIVDGVVNIIVLLYTSSQKKRLQMQPYQQGES